jgi:hypothetical protein
VVSFTCNIRSAYNEVEAFATEPASWRVRVECSLARPPPSAVDGAVREQPYFGAAPFGFAVSGASLRMFWLSITFSLVEFLLAVFAVVTVVHSGSEKHQARSAGDWAGEANAARVLGQWTKRARGRRWGIRPETVFDKNGRTKLLPWVRPSSQLRILLQNVYFNATCN